MNNNGDDLLKRFVLALRQTNGEAGVHCDDCLPLADIIEALTTVLSREAETHKRHDAKVDVLEAEVARVTAERDDARKQAGMSSFAGEGFALMELRALAAEAKLAQGVKPLVWGEDNREDVYVVEASYGPGANFLARGNRIIGWFDAIDDAKAAAKGTLK